MMRGSGAGIAARCWLFRRTRSIFSTTPRRAISLCAGFRKRCARQRSTIFTGPARRHDTQTSWGMCYNPLLGGRMQRPMSATRGIQARLSETLRLTLVYRLARELNAELRSADVVRRVLHSAAEALGTPYASLVSLRRGEIDTAYAIGGAPRTDPRPVLARVLRDGLAGFVLESGRTMVVNDIEVNPLWLPLPDEPLSPQIGSALCVPLIHAGETVGVMTLAHPAREYFTADAINLTATISEMGAAALSNTLLADPPPDA